MKRIGTLAILGFMLYGGNFALAQEPTADGAPESKSRSRIEEIVSYNTPSFIKESVRTTARIIESFRLAGAAAINDKAETKKAQIRDEENREVVDPVDALADNNIERTNPLKIPVTKAGLFVLLIIGSIFEHKIVFYGIIVLILILILRYIFD